MEKPNQVVKLNYSNKNLEFNKRNQKILPIYLELATTVDGIFKQIKPKDRGETFVYMLGRICMRNSEAIFHLSSSGHGFASMQILRSKFEKFVDAAYLHKYPEEGDDFYDFYLVHLKRMDFLDVAKKIDPNYEKTIERFVQNNKKSTRTNWSKKNLRQKAIDIKCDEILFDYAYKMANGFVHSSMGEIVNSFIIEENGTLTPTDQDNNIEDLYADIAFRFSISLTLSILKLQIEVFKLLDDCNLSKIESDILAYYKSNSE